MKMTSPADLRSYSRQRDLKQRQLRIAQARFFASVVFALLASAFIVSTSKADSVVDPLNQAYLVKEVDHIAGLTLQRTYSSRTVFRGHFGLGWCSELDSRVLLYAGHEKRFRGCDLDTAATLDARDVMNLKATARGFERRRTDSVREVFNNDGFLDRLIRPDGEIRIERDADGRPRTLMVHSKDRVTNLRIETSGESDVGFSLITLIEQSVRFEYRDGLLISTIQKASRARDTLTTRFGYDDSFNMVMRTNAELTETMNYETSSDRLTEVARKAPTFEGGRLLLTLASREKSKSEIEMRVERGAEMRPVRFLYDRISKRVWLEGDRSVALLLLNWIRV